MQPTYLPWAGYFNLIAESDIFVFYDDVQFQKRTWGSRNRLLVKEKVNWISVPVHHSQRFSFRETKIVNPSNWLKKHYNLIAHSYANHPFGRDLRPILDFLKVKIPSTLADLNIEIIKLISEHLHIQVDFRFSHEIPEIGGRTERLVRICKYLKCEEYLSPQGSKEYLMMDGNFENSGVQLLFQDYTPKPYSQKNNHLKFISHLSIVDIIANLGWEKTSLYVKKKYCLNKKY